MQKMLGLKLINAKITSRWNYEILVIKLKKDIR